MGAHSPRHQRAMKNPSLPCTCGTSQRLPRTLQPSPLPRGHSHKPGKSAGKGSGENCGLEASKASATPVFSAASREHVAYTRVPPSRTKSDAWSRISSWTCGKLSTCFSSSCQRSDGCRRSTPREEQGASTSTTSAPLAPWHSSTTKDHPRRHSST